MLSVTAVDCCRCVGVWPWPCPRTPFPALPCWLWRRSRCLGPCLPHTKHSLWYRRFRSAFTPAALAFSRGSCPSAELPYGLVPAAATDLGSRRFDVCRRTASLASTTAYSRSCLAIMLNNASGSCVTISKRIFFSTLRRTRVARFPPLLPQPATCHTEACTADRRASPPP